MIRASRLVKKTPGPLNQCEHPNMSECHPPKDGKPGCRHWSCPDCDLSWDEEGEGGPPLPTQADIEEDARLYPRSTE